jgi:putative PIN family toxin of toxin-antitoxin system
VVLDTNVVLALWVFADSRYAEMLALITAGKLLPLTGQDCLGEFERVLRYPEFKLEEEARRRILADYSGRALLVDQSVTPCLALPLCRDPDDQKFLELARDGRADYLLTSDKALLALARRRSLAEQFRIMTPEGFLDRSG